MMSAAAFFSLLQPAFLHSWRVDFVLYSCEAVLLALAHARNNSAVYHLDRLRLKPAFPREQHLHVDKALSSLFPSKTSGSL